MFSRVTNLIMIFILFYTLIPSQLYALRCKPHEAEYKGSCVSRMKIDKLRSQDKIEENRRKRAAVKRRKQAEKARLLEEREENQENINRLYSDASYADVVDAEPLYREIIDNYDSSYDKYDDAQEKLEEISALKSKKIAVVVKTDPEEADVEVDYRNYTSGETFNLSIGKYQMKFKSYGFKTLEYELKVNRDILNSGGARVKAILAYADPEVVTAGDLGLRIYDVPGDISPIYEKKKVLNGTGKFGIGAAVVGSALMLLGLGLMASPDTIKAGGALLGVGGGAGLIASISYAVGWRSEKSVQNKKNKRAIEKNELKQKEATEHNQNVEKRVEEANREKKEEIEYKNEDRGKVEVVTE